MSDVVHHSPPFDREALGGDVVVVDLQENKCLSERSSTSALHTARQEMPPEALVMGTLAPLPNTAFVDAQWSVSSALRMAGSLRN